MPQESQPAARSGLVVESGGQLLGFVIGDRRGWQALSSSARIIGHYPTQHCAASALVALHTTLGGAE